MIAFKSLVASLSLLLSLAHADCDMPGTPGGRIETEPTLCLPQGPGSYTFAMFVDLTSLGIPGGPWGPPNPSVVGGAAFQIMDNNCQVLAAYNPPSCGIPWTIEENFLQYVLTVTSVFMDVGDPYFEFTYANGEYSINNNHCVCSDTQASFPTAAKGCRCAFPVAGEPDKKRAIDFKG